MADGMLVCRIMWWIDRLPSKQRFNDSHIESSFLFRVELFLLSALTSPTNVTEVFSPPAGASGIPMLGFANGTYGPGRTCAA